MMCWGLASVAWAVMSQVQVAVHLWQENIQLKVQVVSNIESKSHRARPEVTPAESSNIKRWKTTLTAVTSQANKQKLSSDHLNRSKLSFLTLIMEFHQYTCWLRTNWLSSTYQVPILKSWGLEEAVYLYQEVVGLETTIRRYWGLVLEMNLKIHRTILECACTLLFKIHFFYWS